MGEDMPMDDGNIGDSGREAVRVLDALSDRVVAFHPAYARIGGSLEAGIFLSQALYWTANGAAVARGGWFYKTQEEWTAETAMSRYEQERARKRLRDLGILEERRRGVPAKLWYRIDRDRVADLLATRPQSSMRHARNLDCGMPADKTGDMPQSITEITQKTTQREDAPPARLPEPKRTGGKTEGGKSSPGNVAPTPKAPPSDGGVSLGRMQARWREYVTAFFDGKGIVSPSARRAEEGKIKQHIKTAFPDLEAMEEFSPDQVRGAAQALCRIQAPQFVSVAAVLKHLASGGDDMVDRERRPIGTDGQPIPKRRGGII